LLNLSKLFDRPIRTLQDLSRYRKELRGSIEGAAPA
jgi:hypothetical protein